MTNNEILKADLLDILFDNRNKAYGAYKLRKTYPQRLLLAVVFTAFFAALISWVISTSVKTVADLVPFDPGVVKMTEYVMPPEQPEEPMKPPVEAKPQPPVEQVATRQYTSNIEIVQDNVIRETDFPPVSELVKAVIGTQNLDGAEPEGAQQPPTEAPAQGTGNAAVPEKEEILENNLVQEMAEFPGGAGAFQRYLAKHLAQPEDLGAGEKRTVKVRFVIEKDGTIDKIILIQSGGDALDRAVMRVLKRAPKWKPARHNGQFVPVVFTQPVTFIGGEE